MNKPSNNDRWTYPAEGDDPRDIDREMTDADSVAARQRERAVTNPQEGARRQGLSSDAPGCDPSGRT